MIKLIRIFVISFLLFILPSVFLMISCNIHGILVSGISVVIGLWQAFDKRFSVSLLTNSTKDAK